MKPSNKTEIAAARQAARAAAQASGNNVSTGTIEANEELAAALDKGNVLDKVFR